MQFICIQFLLTIQLFLILIPIDCIICSNNDSLEAMGSTDVRNDEKTIEFLDKEEDLLVLSSWQSLKYWTSNSSLHSSKIIKNSEVFQSNESNSRRITAIDFYRNESNCENILFWFEVLSQTIYCAIVNTNGQNLYLTELKSLSQLDLGTHIRLAIDSVNKNIYFSSFDFSRIDCFEIETKVIKNYLKNITNPVDIAIDSQLEVLFWIENWSCISYTFITNTSVVRMCSTNARALAVDPPNTQLYWSDINGQIYRRNYFAKDYEIIFSAKKMQQNYALDVTNGAIYLSDRFKLTSINRKTFTNKVVLIESQGIVDFKAIETRVLCQQQRPQTKKRIEKHMNSTELNETFYNVIAVNQSLIRFDSDSIGNNNENNFFSSHYFYLIITFSVIISFILIFLIIIGLKRVFKPKVIKRRVIKRISGEMSHRLRNKDKNKLIFNKKSVGKSVCIEDLGSFSNDFLNSQSFCSNRPIVQTCSSCDDRDECMDRGICLNTYKLLT